MPKSVSKSSALQIFKKTHFKAVKESCVDKSVKGVSAELKKRWKLLSEAERQVSEFLFTNYRFISTRKLSPKPNSMKKHLLSKGIYLVMHWI